MSAVIEKPTAVAAAPSLVSRFAQRYNVEPAKLLSTLKATAFSVSEGEVSNEQMMALLIVADQYHLNPFTKEIYAFPDKKRGGIVPVVGVDGWARIVNEQEAYDGVEFLDGPASQSHKGAPEWIECIMHRKDREHPTRIRERLIECYRDTGPWGSHPARLLRHKAFMQCGRLAFALVGIYDEDEAQRIIDGDPAGGREESPGIAAINKTIVRGKATIEGEAHRIDQDAQDVTAKRVEEQEHIATGEPPNLSGAKKGGPTLADVTAQIEKANALTDKATALLVLDDAELLASGLGKEDKASAAKAIAAARKEIGERVAGKK